MIKFNCPRCKQPITKKWLFNSTSRDVYSCSKCGVKLQWNMFRNFARFVGIFLGIGVIMFTKHKWQIDNSVFKALLAGLIVLFTHEVSLILLPNLLMPNSISVIKDDEKSEDDSCTK